MSVAGLGIPGEAIPPTGMIGFGFVGFVSSGGPPGVGGFSAARLFKKFGTFEEAEWYSM